MVPMTKAYGNHIIFKGSYDTFDTPKEGKTEADTNISNYYGQEPAMGAQMWGDVNPAYRFFVKIKNSNMVDNFSNSLKTFYWDINKEANKLYFSEKMKDFIAT
jgi:hypothetical protein